MYDNSSLVITLTLSTVIMKTYQLGENIVTIKMMFLLQQGLSDPKFQAEGLTLLLLFFNLLLLPNSDGKHEA